MAAIAELAQAHDLQVLADEAYFEMRYSGTSSSIASIDGMAERTTILYTFSKKFAMTGWRFRLRRRSPGDRRRPQQAQHQRRVVHDALRPVAGVAGLHDDSGAA